MNKMLFEIENLGKINKAKLEIGKINVIVGKNSTGKSTSSKFLFSLLTASSNDGIQLANNDIYARLMNFVEYWKFKGTDEMKFQFNQIRNSLVHNIIQHDQFEEFCFKIKQIVDKNDFKDKELCMSDLDRLIHIIEINNDKYAQYLMIFNSLIESEYGVSLNTFKNANIKFHGNSNGVDFKQKIKIANDMSENSFSENFLNYFNFKNVIYIDFPSIFEIKQYKSQFHLQILERKLKNDKTSSIYENAFQDNLNEFKERITDLIGGDFEYNISEDIFLFNEGRQNYPIKNTASGLKQLGVIQLLVKNYELTENSFLILDNPEINLHPEFQIKLAEILVLASKELNITLYINTHSPFIAEAIEVYAKYYHILDETNFYLTEKVENKNKYDYVKMDKSDILDVYNNLGYSFNTLNEIRFETELRDDLMN